MRLSHLGDIILTTGVIDYWHRNYGWTFHFITSQSMLPILQDHPAVASVISVSQEDRSLTAWLQFCQALRRKYAHLPFIDLHGTLRSRILGALWPNSVMHYPKKGLCRRFFQRTHKDYFQKKLIQANVPQRYSLALEKTAPPKELLRPNIPVSARDRAWAQKQLALTQPFALVALHPYATHQAKEWPREKWLALMERLHAQGIACMVIGQSKMPLLTTENTSCKNTQKEQILDFTNTTNIAQTCALLEQADVLVSGDSGPMHMGTAVNTPVVALFGQTCEEWGFYPSGPQDTVITLSLPCSPCSLHGNHACTKNFACMRDISVDQVLKTILARIPATQ